MEKIKVVEIFDSIEGEGSLIGYPTTFIRLEGCNLRCSWCDTKYSYDTENYKLLSLSQIMLLVEEFKNKKVCITGGEPLFNEGFDILLKELLKEKYFTIVETNGTLFRESIKTLWEKHEDKIYIVCSPKPFSNFYINENLKFHIKELKFVVDDYLEISHILNVLKKFTELPVLVLQPESNRQDMFEKSRKLQKELLTKYELEFRIIPQIHKIYKIS
jgi:organic radical activating enzyme